MDICAVQGCERLKKQWENSIKLGKKFKYRLKIKEKAEIVAQENCQKWENQLKRGTLTPLEVQATDRKEKNTHTSLLKPNLSTHPPQLEFCWKVLKSLWFVEQHYKKNIHSHTKMVRRPDLAWDDAIWEPLI